MLLGEKIPLEEGVKEGHPLLKDVILPIFGRLAWK